MEHKIYKVLEIVKTCLDNNIPVIGMHKVDDYMAFEIAGFSKSGTATIWQTDDDEILCETRYNQIDEIDDFIDLASIAFTWNKNYLNRGYGWDINWINVFINLGWIKNLMQR